MKKSKENSKIKPSINLIALTLLILSVTIVVINLDIVSGNFITLWLFEHNPFPFFIRTPESMDVTLTAILFSVIAFSISKLISQWKETAKFRKAKREMRKREKVLCKMSAKELLDAAKMKDEISYNNLLKNSDENKSTNDEEVKEEISSEEKPKKHKREKIKKAKEKKSKVKEETTSNAKNF